MGLKYLPAIDGLRAVAVLSVLAYHAGLGGAGYVGVDVFFVISGYLITRLLKEDGDLVAFYARRARRILPAAILVVLATLALSALLLPDSGDVARSASAAAVFGANFWFQSATSDYWSSSAEQMPLLHLWSLSVEEQFYLLWPFVLLGVGHGQLRRRHEGHVELLAVNGDPAAPVALRRDHNLGGRQLFAQVRLRLVGFVHGAPIIWLVFLASLALYAYLWRANPSAAFYQMPARAWELAAGGLVALVHRDAAAAVRAGVVVFGVPLVHDDVVVPLAASDDLATVPRVSSRRGGLFAALGLALHPFSQQLHAARARLNVPTILRNLRIFILQHGSHIGLAIIAAAILAPLPVWASQSVAVIGATLVVANPHSKLLEARPMVWVGLISYSLYLWHWPLLALDRAVRVGEAPLGVRLALCGVAVILAALTYRYVETPFRRAQVRPGRTIALGVTCVAALACTAFVMADTKPVVKPVAQLEEFVAKEVPPASCHQTAADPVKACAGDVIVWGDSMAWAWSPLGDVGNSRDACGPFVGYQQSGMGFHKRCKEFNDAALVQAQRAREVILVAAWLSYPPEVVARLDATLAQLDNVTIIGPTPALRDKMPRCLRYGVEGCAVPRAEFDAQAEPMRKLLRDLAAKHGARYVETVDYFCTATECPALKDGKPLYWDERHVSVSAVLTFTHD